MVRIKSGVFLAFLVLVSLKGYPQDRFAVYFKYKPQTHFSLSEPEKFLSSRALDRRVREGVLPDSTDLPLSMAYLEPVSALVEKVQYTTKWFNAAIVVATNDQIDQIKELPFVEKTELVARGFYRENVNERKGGGKEFKKKKNEGISNTNTYDFQNEMLGIQDMHGEGFTGKGIRIAVFDAGFLNADRISAFKHLFKNNQIVGSRDFVLFGENNVFRTDGHGTAALSLLASNEPGKLVSGAYDAEYILCITEDVRSEYRVEEFNWVKAAEYSDSLGVDIINSSLGYNYFDDSLMNYRIENLDGKTAIISQGASKAAEKGILVITSAGNEGNISWKTITAPADAAGVLSVGAVNNAFGRAGFSSIGPTADGRIKPELVAFGTGVTLWRNLSSPSSSSGTSFSAPQVAALAAGLWQARPDWTKKELIERLLNSGSQANAPDSELGFGIPNFLLAYLEEFPIENPDKELLEVKIYPNPLDGKMLFLDYGLQKICDFSLINALGMVVASEKLKRISNRFPYEVELTVVPGLYLVSLNEGKETQFLRLIKK